MHRPNLDRQTHLSGLLAVVMLLLTLAAGPAQTVILHLKNGDRIAGAIVTEDTNRVVITTEWIKDLAVPLSEISGRETPLPQLPATNAPPPGPAIASRLAAPSGHPASTNDVKHWKGEAHIGADYLYGAKD